MVAVHLPFVIHEYQIYDTDVIRVACKRVCFHYAEHRLLNRNILILPICPSLSLFRLSQSLDFRGIPIQGEFVAHTYEGPAEYTVRINEPGTPKMWVFRAAVAGTITKGCWRLRFYLAFATLACTQYFFEENFPFPLAFFILHN